MRIVYHFRIKEHGKIKIQKVKLKLELNNEEEKRSAGIFLPIRIELPMVSINII